VDIQENRKGFDLPPLLFGGIESWIAGR